MDPVGAVASVLQITKNAYALGKYIHDVYEGAKRIDENVRSLASEVNGLADSCKLVHDELHTVLTRSPPGAAGPLFDNDGRLGRCVDQQVVQCDSTLDELRRVVDVLWPRNGTLYQRVSKQIDLQNSRAQTNEIRKRIRSHTDALHTILLVINIRVSHFASDYTPQQLLGNLDDLKARLVNIESKLGGSQSRRNSTGDGNTTLVDVAEETLRSGKTLYEKSLVGTVRGNDSVLGDEQSVIQAGTVGNWVDTVNKLRRASREGCIAELELPPGFSDDGKDTTATGSTSGGVFQLPRLDEDDSYDSDDEQVELAQAALLKGNRAFDAQNWELAAKVLQTSLKLLYKLPHKHKRQQDIFGLQYRLAVCSYHTGDIDHAEAGLESLLQHEPVSDKEGIQLCDARHLLSRIYVERDKLELARDACEGTLKARSRLLGKQHEARFESMALMSRISQLLQDDVLSDLYASRIPDAKRDDLLAAVSTLQPNVSLTTPDSMLVLLTTSEPSQYPGSNAQEAGPSPRAIPVQNHSPGYGPPPSFSPRLSPLCLSPKTQSGEFPGSLDIDSTSATDRIGPSPLDDKEAHRRRSTITRSSYYDTNPQTMIGIDAADVLTTSNPPVRPSRIYSAPVITVTPTQSVRKPSRAPSVIFLDEPQDIYPPLRTSGLENSVTPPGPMSRSERHKLVKRFKMERKCMHNLDQSICDGTLEDSLKLVAGLHSNSTGNSGSPIVFNQWADGLRLATKSPALHLAILFGDDALVEPLIKNGFSPTFACQLSDEPGMRDYLTPLDLAIASRNESIIHILLSDGAVLGPPSSDSPCRQLLSHTSLQFWPPRGLPEVLSLLELLISCGWPVSKGFSRQNKSSSTPTFLHQACALSVHLQAHRLPLVKLLIEKSDTTTLFASATETPLHHAIRRDDPEVVDSLLQAQASFRLRGLLDKKNSHDCQPLYIAVQRAIADHDLPLDIIRSLLDRGANLDEPHTLTETRLLRLSKKTRTTARSIAMASGRQDLIALVKSVGEQQPARPLTRAHTVSGGVLMDRAALLRIGAPQ